ncbi:disulfide bond formation protein B [Niveibacterium sp. 24ML]|uniref:disulfide bond formation protein B n=1 Tax=Niveibacterium sp. 24ML TaxID=2985512 RepID=UPI0022718F9E|nr:disulfide bond formation protein B [Niveibacterium sp. 24ML]MCX9156965.1 disulfide bond formation protein B [Niveibacterium sp. 24ML]
MITRFSQRQRFTAIAVFCFGLLASGLVLQTIKNVQPCPMCIMQRYAFAAAGLLALLAALHNPRGRGGFGYALMTSLVALTGLGIAARQSWLQWFPPKFVECGPDLEFMMNSFPIAQALPMIFQGSGDCAKVDWTLFGLTIANLSGLAFIAIFLVALSVLLQRRERNRFSR